MKRNYLQSLCLEINIVSILGISFYSLFKSSGCFSCIQEKIKTLMSWNIRTINAIV